MATAGLDFERKNWNQVDRFSSRDLARVCSRRIRASVCVDWITERVKNKTTTAIVKATTGAVNVRGFILLLRSGGLPPSPGDAPDAIFPA